FKVTGLITVATLMILNVQLSNMDENSMISLSYLKNLAFAQSNENGGGDDCGNWFWPCDSLYTEVNASCECIVQVVPGGVGGSYTIPRTTQVFQSRGPDFCTTSFICKCGYI